MPNNIVSVFVTQQIAPAPNTLQSTGAFVSQGATNTTPGTLSLLTQFSDLTPLLAGGVTITAITVSGGVGTVTVTPAQTSWQVGPQQITISGCIPTQFNAIWAANIMSTTQFTIPIGSNPGSLTTPGIATLEDVAELTAMATTWFAQGNQNAIYVFEMGEGTNAEGVTYLNTYIQNNLFTVYIWFVPSAWSSESTFLTMVMNYESTTAKTYFFVPMTLSNYGTFTKQMKSVLGLVPAPSVLNTVESDLAAAGHVPLAYAPSTVNLVTPYQFSEITGVTPYPIKGNQTVLANLKAANVNYIDTGAEGGITNTIIKWGTTMDGNDFNYWYSVDWVQINVELDIANAIINGSNNPQNPLYYNQNGINRLQAVAQNTMNRGVSFGLVLNSTTNPVIVKAVPFNTYVTQNPSDYPLGVYSGLSVSYVPQLGFTRINFYVSVTTFPTA